MTNDFDINRIGYVALEAADPEHAAKFATERLGFALAHIDPDGTHYLRGHGPDPYALVYVPGEDKRLSRVRYVLPNEAAVTAARTILEAQDVRVEEAEQLAWDQTTAIRVVSPAGHSIELGTGVTTDLPVGRSGAFPDSPLAPIASDHVAYGAPDFDAEAAFFGQTLGFLTSSTVVAPGGDPVMAFLRAPRRYLYHQVNVSRTGTPRLHHVQFSLRNRDALDSAVKMLRANDVEIEWGPFRHAPGHNVALYIADGAGHYFEYSIEEEIILDDASFIPRTWTAAPEVADEWGTGRPPPEWLTSA